MIQLNDKNIDNFKDNGYYDYNHLKNALHEDKIEGFMFKDNNTNKIIGMYWAYYRGLNSYIYRIRDCDATLDDLFVFPEFRGNNYAPEMMQCMFEYLFSNGKTKIRNCIRKNNPSSIRAHLKTGIWMPLKSMRYIQILRLKIPYCKV